MNTMNSESGNLEDSKIECNSEAKICNYVVKKITQETEKAKSFVLSPLDEPIIFPKAGMFIKIHENDERGAFERSYSVASPPSFEDIELIIEMIGGRMTSKLDKIKVGDILKISGPYGDGFDESKKSVAIAGGTGVTPFLNILQHILIKKLNTEFTLFYSAKNYNEVLKKELLFRDLPKNVKVIVTLTQEKDTSKWNGETGRINTDMLLKYVPDLRERAIYLSGPFEMVTSLRDKLISIGVKITNIHFDVWFVPSSNEGK